MGNGPSLKGVNFEILKKYDTFGLNAAYRIYPKLNFWPTYFGCFDYVVCEDHKNEFENLVRNSNISEFYFVNDNQKGEKIFIDGDILTHKKFIKLNFIYKHNIKNLIQREFIEKNLATNLNFFIDAGNSGANACQIGMLKGYKKIILLGCDCNYVELVEGARKEDNRLIMDYTTTKNPNYWFDDYQRKGDKFNIPQVLKWQMPGWERISRLSKDIEIVNCSSISHIPYFRISTLEKEL